MSEDLEFECTKQGIRQALAYFTELDCGPAVENACPPSSNVEWTALYYCDLDESLGAFIPIGLIFIVLLFYLLATTADSYLSPALEQLSLKLGISESIAGVTLLALGNGAPDVISSLSASGAEGGVYLAVGALLGGGFFISGLVSAVVTIVAPSKDDGGIRLKKGVFLRDTLFYVFSLLVLFGVALYGTFSLPWAIAFLLIYLFFATFVIVQESVEKKRRRLSVAHKMLADSEDEDDITDALITDADDPDNLEDIIEDKDLELDLVEVTMDEIEMRKKKQQRNRLKKMTVTEEKVMDLLDVPFMSGGLNSSTANLVPGGEDRGGGSFVNARSVGVAGTTRFSELRVEEEDEKEEQKNDDYNPLSRTEAAPRLDLSNLKGEAGSPPDGSKSPFSRSPTKKRMHGEYNDDAQHSFITGDYFASIVEDSHNLRASGAGEEKKHPLQRQLALKLTKKTTMLGRSMQRTRAKLVWSAVKMKMFFKKSIETEDSWAEMRLPSKLLYLLIDLPFGFLRNVTIPPCEDASWDNRFASVFWPCAVLFCYVITRSISVYSWPPVHFWVLEAVAAVVGIVVCFTTHTTKAPSRPFMAMFAGLSFFMSIMWIWWIANTLIDLLQLFGLITGISPAFLGITVLAYGNSVGDLMANQAIAKKGLARMAITGCFAGPLFNLLIGLGLTLVLLNSSDGAPEFKWNSESNMLPMIALAALFVMTLYTIVVTAINGFVLTKFHAWVRIVFVIAVSILITVVAFWPS